MEKDKISMLENLLLSEDLNELNYMTSEFNMFNALKLQNNEIRHSNLLSWLLSPFENHKLGDYFVKEFLMSAIRAYSQKDEISISLTDVVFEDFSDMDIKREYKNIDLLLVSSKNKLVCIIENKIWTGEHDCQLERYADIINTEFKDYKKLYIYLAPDNICKSELLDRTSKNVREMVYYIPMNYEQVHDIIEKTLRYKSNIMTQDVKMFLNHYSKMIERDILGIMDDRISDLCKTIYKNHKNAIDLIVNINSVENENIKKDVFEILKQVIGENESIDKQYTEIEDNSILCLPKGISNPEKLKFGVWKQNEIILYMHFMNFKPRKDKLCIEFAISKVKDPVDKEKRVFLKEHLQNELKCKFNGNDNWAYTSPDTIITFDEAYNCKDKDEIKTLINSRINNLKEKYIVGLKNAINSAIEQKTI